jgi:hypothetical protein
VSVIKILMPSAFGVSLRRVRSFFTGSLISTVISGALVAGVPTVAHAQKPKKPVAVRCDGAAGWSGAIGVPNQLAKNGPLGLYVWNQKGVWRITATGPERKLRLFQGTVTFDAPISVKPFGLEGRSDAAVATENSVAFTFKNFGQRDGIGVEAPCATSVTVTGTIDGVALAPTQVFIGSAGSPAPTVPVVLRKDAPAPPTSVLTETAASACPTVGWASNTVGRPNGLKRFKSRALHVWFESGRWQFFATPDAGRPQVIEGRATFNAPVTVKGSVDPNVLRVEPRFDGSSVVFSFRDGEMPDGFAVASPCASSVTIELFADGVALPTSNLLVGPGSAPATAMPFVIAR